MKLVVLVPSEEYKSQAGARIRYSRLAGALSKYRIDLAIQDIGTFSPDEAQCDALLISKCYDARGVIAAAAMRQRCTHIGVDLFDDYFSQADDTRLLRFRAWLHQIVRHCDFALSSTEALAQVIRSYSAQLPTHVLNDPGVELERGALSTILQQKLERTRNSLRLKVAWFGMGDNPYFPVGLTDLAAFAPNLLALARGEFAVELTVLTNPRALDRDGLELIRELPIVVDVLEWSESAEHELLREALLAFLPVNAQPFSVSKSLNRALTALSAGCQVLSVGYPLYRSLGELIYRSADTFLDDLTHGSLRLSSASLNTFGARLKAVGSADTEAQNLAGFLARLPKPRAPQRIPLSVVHGHLTHGEAHSLAKAVGGISIASPYSTATLDFDAIFRFGTTALEMFVSQTAASRLNPHVRTRLKGSKRVHGQRYVYLPHASSTKSESKAHTPRSVPLDLATYPHVLNQIEERVTDAFGPCCTIVSEASSLPYFPQPRAA